VIQDDKTSLRDMQTDMNNCDSLKKNVYAIKFILTPRKRNLFVIKKSRPGYC